MSYKKTQFELVDSDDKSVVGNALIIGREPNYKPYVSLKLYGKVDNSHYGFVADKDLERFAVNILKAIKSKKLK